MAVGDRDGESVLQVGGVLPGGGGGRVGEVSVPASDADRSLGRRGRSAVGQGVAIGVFGLSFYQNNTDKLKVATIDGVVPSVESISKGEYPVSRPLYFYVKKAHLGVIPGLQEYIDFFVSDDMAGPEGPLAAYGLVSDPELAATQAAVAAGTPMGPLN